jgi:mannuronan synthase
VSAAAARQAPLSTDQPSAPAQTAETPRPEIGVLSFGERLDIPRPAGGRRALPPLSAKADTTYGFLLTPPDTWTKWNPKVLFILAFYLAACTLLLFQTPNIFWNDDAKHIMVAIGGLGMWRFAWWFNHGVRALIYEKSHYPRLREKADWAWANGQKPRHVHIMMTTYKENPEVTELVMESIVREVRACGLSATIWLGSGDDSDEVQIANYLATHADDLDFELVIARQWKSGKRYAIGAALRAMRLSGTVDGSDAVVFMDGDSIWAPGMLQKCVSLFFIDPKLQALTTDEEVICHGPRWMEVWLRMRFAQRRIGMMSHALAGKVLTLTGRLSLFRAHHVIQPGFISILEEDYLQHWLWGRFRFLSGDDKSTWYYMLTQSAKMMYVPDALAITIEHVEGNGYDRMVQNLRRWSGNMLRNGSRAIALGPRKVGLFIWWCVVDQRLAMWTMLVSPILAVLTAIYISPLLLFGYILWIAVSRMIQSIWLYCYSRDVHISFPLIIFTNQLLNASVKVYSLFRLSKQRWTNRGNQSAGFEESWVERLRGWMASYLTLMSMSVLVLLVTTYAGFLQGPSAYTLQVLGLFR